MELDEGRVVEMVLEEYDEILGWKALPVYTNIVRHPEAIPLYALGHLNRIERVEQILCRHPGLYLTGNAYRGVALNDCTREATRIARQIREDLLRHLW
jgi:oxygen-dependent protoporphyrinogen oxidase